MEYRRVTSFLIAAAAALLPLTSQAAPGLAERRAMTQFQEQKFPELKKQVETAAGFEVPLEVDWTSLMVDGESARYNADPYLADIFFYPLIEALKSITRDDMGKTALKAGLKKVVIKYDPDTAPISNYEDGWTFEDGVLTLNYQPGVNSDGKDGANFKERVAAITKNLEKKL